MGEPFLIKHRSSGKYFHPEGGAKNPENGTSIILNKHVHERMFWTFERVRGQWGYIKHVSSGKIIHPQGGELDSKDGTPLVLHQDRHDGALFALDVYKHQIVHLSGCFAQPNGLKPNPPDETKVILHSKVSNAKHFIFVSPRNPAETVNVYEKPKLGGKWEILSMVGNPSATHTETLAYKVGNSRSKSTDAKVTVKMQYEISEGLNFFEIINESAKFSTSVEFMFSTSSSETWSTESTQKREIRVEPGNTVVTWQYVFDLDHCGTTSMFKSNLLADTDSASVKPQDLQIGRT